jgi:hypothetical protein
VRRAGATTPTGLHPGGAECLADCDRAPCVQVNHRFVRRTTPRDFDQLVDDLRRGRLADDVPRTGPWSGYAAASARVDGSWPSGRQRAGAAARAAGRRAVTGAQLADRGRGRR